MKITKLKNALITNNSVVIANGKILPQSCVTSEHFARYNKLKFRLKYFFPFFSFSKKPHILITDEWSKNYCHWLWEALSKLIVLKKEMPDAILILPKSYLKIDFVMKSLTAFGFNKGNIRTIPGKSFLYVRNLAFIPCININTAGYYDMLLFREIVDKIITKYQSQLKTNFGDRIYISRNSPKSKAGRRIKNKEEFKKILVKFGFKKVYMEDFSFLEQISIISNAKFILAPHGAGITNAMFARCDVKLLELNNQNWAEENCFFQMCQRLQISYHRLDCEEIRDDKKNMEVRDIRVNIGDLEQNLIKFLR